jgi:hypothetical protein
MLDLTETAKIHVQEIITHQTEWILQLFESKLFKNIDNFREKSDRCLVE